MNAEAVAKKIAEIFEETDAYEVSEVCVEVADVESITAVLKRRGYDVKTEKRYGDSKRTKVARYALTVRRGGQKTDNSGGVAS